MKLKVMKWIDHWFGLPICFALGVFVMTYRKFFKSPKIHSMDTKGIAIFKFFGLGSIIQSLPLLRAIKARYPEGKLVFITFSGNEALLKNLNLCDTIYVLRTQSLWNFVFDVIKIIFQLRRQKIYASVDLEFFSKFSTLLSFLSGARIRIGFHLNDFWRYSLVNSPVYFNYFRHIGEIYADVGRHLDFKIADYTLPRITPGDEDIAAVKNSLQNLGWQNKQRLVGININANDFCLERRWPLDHWSQLVSKICRQYAEVKILLTGSKNEKIFVDELYNIIPPENRSCVLNVAGLWNLPQCIAGLSLLDVFVTNDSGPMHLAAITRTRTVSLWGPGRPSFYEPLVKTNASIFADYHCSPCLYMFTSFAGMWCHHEGWCMTSISPLTVFNAVEDILKAKK